jgi:hypothetical protein
LFNGGLRTERNIALLYYSSESEDDMSIPAQKWQLDLGRRDIQE